MATKNLGWVVECDDCGLLHGTAGGARRLGDHVHVAILTSSSALLAAVADGWSSTREQTGASWRRVERCPECQKARVPVDATSGIKMPATADDWKALGLPPPTSITVLTDEQIKKIEEDIASRRCAHGYQRHPLDGGMAPGCAACVDELAARLEKARDDHRKKTLVPPRAFASYAGGMTCARCLGHFETHGAAAEHTEFECEANQARGIR